eukprot:sb/3461996/
MSRIIMICRDERSTGIYNSYSIFTDTPVVKSPEKISLADQRATMVACGSTHTVILADNAVWSCGKYLDGQLGRCPSDFSRQNSGSSVKLQAKGWYSYLSRVPGFGEESDRIVVSVYAVGNRTFVKCRTPLLDSNTTFGGGWGYSGKSLDAILFSVEEDIHLHGVGLYGGRGNYSAKLRISVVGYSGGAEADDGDLLLDMPSFTFSCKPKQTHRAMFDEPVHIVGGTWYRVIVKVDGPSSDCGNSGKREITVDGVKFTFHSSKKSTNGTDYGSGQIPQLIFRKVQDPGEKGDEEKIDSDVMTLGRWEEGMEHVLGIVKQSFTALHTYIKTKQKEPGKLNKSTMSLNFALSDVSVTSDVIKCDVITCDPAQTALEKKLCVSVTTLSVYLSETPPADTPHSSGRRRLLKESQDLLVGVLKLPISGKGRLGKVVGRVYSTHSSQFHESPHHYWAAFLSNYESYKGCDGARELLQRLFQQMVLVSLNQFGPLCVATSKETAHRFRGVELASWNQGKSKADAISFKVDQPNVFLNGVGVYEGCDGARELLQRLFQQMVLVSLNQFGPLCVATSKETAHRFRGVELASWNAGKSKADAISFKVDQPNVFLNGVGVYETLRDSSCDVELLMKDKGNGKWRAVFSHSAQLKKTQAEGHLMRVYFKKPLPLMVDFNSKDRGDRQRDEYETETVIVESEHPYAEGTVLHYQAVLSDNVGWMVLDFSPESGIGPDDTLEVFVTPPSLSRSPEGGYNPLVDKNGTRCRVLKLSGSAKDWPKRPLLLPNNRLSFVLKSVTKGNVQQMNHSDWGFSCKITGYKFGGKQRKEVQLEHVLADIAGCCVRVMISPSSTTHQHLSQWTLSQLPPILLIPN